ncbi:hypothetical protein FGO68_gene7728 [Halteria grandinella]|uniref:Uncharacterized protein n=1 Tax=Halteria grandinella TaxID=5974 RepID=A0A8J8SUK7_HALGN|nr:hypothetical protein FGO68_gene7728 [Halteria grandinella]
MTISADLIRQLALAGDDFGFEMRMGKILQTITGAQVEHGGTYKPLGINMAPRQFDYRVKVVSDNRVLRLAVECKNFYAGSPVVVCGSRRTREESYLDLIVSDFREVISRHGDEDDDFVGLVQKTSPSSFYVAGDFVGRATLRPEPGASKERELVKDSRYKLTGDADIYEKWNQAVTHSVRMADWAINERQNSRHFVLSAVLPIVVMPDETLWQIQYDDDGNIVDGPKPVNSTTLYVGVSQYLGNSTEQTVKLSHIHFMTATGLTEFCEKVANNSSELWDIVFDPSAIRWYDARRSKPLQLP